MLKEGVVVRIKRDFIDTLKYFYPDNFGFVDHLSKYLDKNLVIIKIDDTSHQLTFIELEDMDKYETILFETHVPSSNLMRVGNTDIEFFEPTGKRIAKWPNLK